MCRLTLSVIILFLSLHYAHQYQIPTDEENREPDNHFDVLVFSQHWPVTVCLKWTQRTAGKCVYPTKKNRWTIHGTWPKQAQGGYTQYCNKSWTFEPKEIESIVDDLDQAWTNIHKETEHYSFWEYEWNKHGTCATDLESLNSEFKYFNQSIVWNVKYSMSDMLEAANINPSDTKQWKPEDFLAAVQARTKKSASIWCYVSKGVVHLEEIRICFDKQFNPIDCEEESDTKCSSSTGVIYPANL